MFKTFLIATTFFLTFNANSQTICKRVVADFGTSSGGYLINGSAIFTDSLGSLYLTLSSDFSTAAGPDLYLYLSINDAAPTVLGNTNVEVALMTSNTGTQSYLVPAGYNLTDFDYVLVHCKQFDSFWDGGALGAVTCNVPTEIVEEEVSLEKLVVKNNGAESVRIEVLSLYDYQYNLEIYTASGKLVHSSVEKTNTDFNVEKSLSTGVYFVKVIFENRTLIEKIVKKK